MDIEQKSIYLFGGDSPWTTDDWTASDDRVRGGKSQSYLSPSPDKQIASFNGTLDIKTLGGAGFASQRTTAEDKTWNLSAFDGIELRTNKADGKRYTIILKDELLPQTPTNGREQSTISYEYDLQPKSSSTTTPQKWFIPWSSFKPTYRGKEKPDAKKLDPGNVKRFSIMMRSFFGDQEGAFELEVQSIAAVKAPSSLSQGTTTPPLLPTLSSSISGGKGKGDADVEKAEAVDDSSPPAQGFLSSPWYPICIAFFILAAGWFICIS